MIHIYRNPETSEVVNDEEFTRLVDALCADPTEGAQIVERGVIYARVAYMSNTTAPSGYNWAIMRPGVQRLVVESMLRRVPQLENPTVWEKVDQ